MDAAGRTRRIVWLQRQVQARVHAAANWRGSTWRAADDDGVPGGIHDGRWREPGHSANVKALGKWRSYKGARRRQEEGGKGWLVKGKGTAADVFVPFAFEVGGGLGREAEAFLGDCTTFDSDRTRD